MKKYLMTKRTPFQNNGKGSDGNYGAGPFFYEGGEHMYYDEQREHEIFSLDADTLMGAAYILGFPLGTINSYQGIDYYKLVRKKAGFFITISAYPEGAGIGLFYPPKYGDQLDV